MRENPYYKFFSKTRLKEVCKQCGLTFADDRIVEAMFIFERDYNGPPLEFEGKRKRMAKNNPRLALIEEAYQKLKEEIEIRRALEIEKKEKK